MANFTPGPWFVDAGETYNVRDGGTEGVVSQIHFLRGRHGLAGRITAEQGLANANLIAAAPEMYEALKASVEISWALYGALRQMVGGSMPTVESVDGMARAALAKADGKVAR